MDAHARPTGRTALVLGATGGIGGEFATVLARRGWHVRALSRGAGGARGDGWEWVQGDAMDAAVVRRAAEGADVIFHGVNPPGYRQWDRVVLPMLDHTLEAARRAGARVLLPGTIYNYGPDAFPVLTESSPQHATTHKGRIRIELEQRLARAADRGVRSLTVRFGDFFGPKPGSSWFSQAVVTPGRPVRSVTAPGPPGVGHTWAYLPDCGETFAALLDREERLEPVARFHFRGHWDPDGRAMAAAIGRAVGNADLPVRRLPWWLFRLAAPFNETMRELYAVRPLWEVPIELDNGRLVALLGAEPHTPLDEAVAATLRGLGCL
jgi:nucleoside-diphosphate-sugar epimerase